MSYHADKLQAQNWVKFDFEVKFDPEGHNSYMTWQLQRSMQRPLQWRWILKMQLVDVLLCGARKEMLTHFRLLLQDMCLYAIQFPFSFWASLTWPPLLFSRLACRLNKCVFFAVNKSLCARNCLIGLVFGGGYLLCYFSWPFLGFWPDLSNSRTSPRLGMIFSNSWTFPILPDVWEPCGHRIHQ